MAGENRIPGAAQGASRSPAGSSGGTRRFDLDRFTQEVAAEIGVNPADLSVSNQQIRRYESQLHSGTQRSGSR